MAKREQERNPALAQFADMPPCEVLSRAAAEQVRRSATATRRTRSAFTRTRGTWSRWCVDDSREIVIWGPNTSPVPSYQNTSDAYANAHAWCFDVRLKRSWTPNPTFLNRLLPRFRCGGTRGGVGALCWLVCRGLTHGDKRLDVLAGWRGHGGQRLR